MPDWDGFLERLSAGESAHRTFGQMGMPSRDQHRTKIKRDSAYRAKYESIIADNKSKRDESQRTDGLSKSDARYGEIFPRLLSEVQGSSRSVDVILKDLGGAAWSFWSWLQRHPEERTEYELAIAERGRPDPSSGEGEKRPFRSNLAESGWEAFICRVKAGEPAHRLFGQPGMPSRDQHRRRFRQDPVYRSQYEAVCRSARAQQNYQAACETIVAQLGTARSLADIMADARVDPSAFSKWLRRNPDWRKRYHSAWAESGRAARYRRFSEEDYRRAIDLLSRHSDPVAEWRSTDNLPGYYTLQARAARDPVFAVEFRGARLERIKRLIGDGAYTTHISRRPQCSDSPDRRATLLRLLRDGASLSEVRRGWRANGALSRKLLQEAQRTDAAFAAEILLAQAEGKLAAKPSKAARPKKASAPRPKRVLEQGQLRAKLSFNEFYAAADNAVRRSLPDDDRQDIIVDLIEAALAGEIALEDMKAEVQSFISRHYRHQRKFASLDETLFDDGGETFVDRLSADDFNYAE